MPNYTKVFEGMIAPLPKWIKDVAMQRYADLAETGADEEDAAFVAYMLAWDMNDADRNGSFSSVPLDGMFDPTAISAADLLKMYGSPNDDYCTHELLIAPTPEEEFDAAVLHAEAGVEYTDECRR